MAINFAQNLVFNGLGTLSFTIPQDGSYRFDGKISIPTIVNGGGPSSLLVVVNQNGSPVYTGVAGAEGFKVDLSCLLGDVIAMVFSSSAAADLALNVIKSTIAISQGD